MTAKVLQPAEDLESDHHGQNYIDYHQPPYQAPAIVSVQVISLCAIGLGLYQ